MLSSARAARGGKAMGAAGEGASQLTTKGILDWLADI